MIDPDRFNAQVAELELLLRDKLGVRGKSLTHQLKRAGRLLPKRVRKAGQMISSALAVSGHPRLARLHDPLSIEIAVEALKSHLQEIDAADRRKGAILQLLGGIVFNLLVFLGVVTAFLRWQGVV